MTLSQITFILLTYLIGSLPLSLWLGKIALGLDIRDYGDHNPGATNVYRAGGLRWFIPALLLDISKAAAPVGTATYLFSWQGIPLLLIAIAPMLGHAFSPFLAFKGGKSAATALGMWIGLTLWHIALPAVALIIIWSLIIKPSGYAIMATLVSLAIILWVQTTPAIWWWAWLAQLMLLTFTYRKDFTHTPILTSTITKHINKK